MSALNWSEEFSPNSGETSFYDHVYVETPLGRAIIEWKSWKKYDSYTLSIDGAYIDDFDTLELAKAGAADYLESIALQIFKLLNLQAKL